MYVACRIGWGVCWSGVAMPLRSKQSGDDALCNIRASTSKICRVASPCVSYVVVHVAISPRHVSARPLPSKQSGDDALYVMSLVVFISARPLPSSRAATTQRMLCVYNMETESSEEAAQRHRHHHQGRAEQSIVIIIRAGQSGTTSSPFIFQGRAEQSKAEHRHRHHHQGRAEQSIVIIIIHLIFRAEQSGTTCHRSSFIHHPSHHSSSSISSSSIASFVILIVHHPSHQHRRTGQPATKYDEAVTHGAARCTRAGMN